MNAPLSGSWRSDKGRTARAFGLLVLGILALIVLGLWISGRSKVEQLASAIEQDGDPVTLAGLDAMYPPIPDSSNGAIALLRVWEQTSPDYWRAFREGASTLPRRTEPAIPGAVPFRGDGPVDFPRSSAVPPTNAAAAEEFLAANSEHMEAVRQALRASEFRFPIRITNGFFMLLPHLAELKREAQNFRIEGLMAVERGNADGAIDDLKNIVAVGDTLAREPVLLSQLVRLSCDGMVLDDIERLLSRRTLTDRQLATLNSLLGRLDAAGGLRLGLIAERVTCASIYDLPPETLARFGHTVDDDSAALSPALTYKIGMGMLSLTGLKDLDRRLMLETLSEAITLSDQIDSESVARFETLFQNAETTARQFPPRIFSAMLLPSARSSCSRFARFESRRRAALVGVAVARYRLAHDGRVPESLDALVPDFLLEIPSDPFDGKPIRLLPRGNGFVAYSIGVDRVDDAGTARSRNFSKHYDETFIVEPPAGR